MTRKTQQGRFSLQEGYQTKKNLWTKKSKTFTSQTLAYILKKISLKARVV